MAIIAYKQPITKPEVEQVRGVDSGYAIQILLDFKLIEVVGRKDAIGKPLLYGTTDEFLKRFELQSIEDLPEYDELLERIQVIHTASDDVSLFGQVEGNPSMNAGNEVPEFLKDEEGIENITSDTDEINA